MEENRLLQPLSFLLRNQLDGDMEKSPTFQLKLNYFNMTSHKVTAWILREEDKLTLFLKNVSLATLGIGVDVTLNSLLYGRKNAF